jgi:Na+/citrate or Na+/malate symporter
MEKSWSRVPGGCLILRRTGLQAAGRNITLTLYIISRIVIVILTYHRHKPVDLINSLAFHFAAGKVIPKL